MPPHSPAPGTDSPRAAQPTLGEPATGLGVPVFPCGGDKCPVVKTGFKAASSERSRILTMFKRPGAVMIGMPTGEASGHLVVDIDIHGDRSGMAWFEAHRERLPRTRTHRTMNGGLHLILRNPAGRAIGNSAGRIAIGVDVRGAGGYVIIPPSPGCKVIDDAEPADMPHLLIEACSRPEPSPQPAPGPKAPPRADGGTRYGLTALADECHAIRAAPRRSAGRRPR